MNARTSRNARITVKSTVALATLCAAASLHAESANMAIGAAVPPNCSITAANIDFGVYDPTGANQFRDLEATGQVIVICTTGAWASINLSEDHAPGASGDAGRSGAAGARAMIGGNARNPGTDAPDNDLGTLYYTLYSDIAMTQIWGETPESAVVHIGSGGEEVLTVYGNVPAGQSVAPGSYSDTIVATVTF